MYSAIGMMSGTSMDGIDVALLRSDGNARLERGPSAFYPYEPEFRHRIEAGLADARSIMSREERPGALGELERDLTLRHADAARKFLASLPERFLPVDLVGFHGQTVLHRPEIGLTVQLGDASLLARELAVDVVHDMRAADMKAGGQGAPLVPAYHAALARQAEDLPLPAVFVNIGGISNITYVPEVGEPIAFDTGPGNMLIDLWVQERAKQPYDRDGVIGAEGRINEAVIADYLALPFFGRKPPKSLDRADFTVARAGDLSLADGARSFAALAARAILKAQEHLPRRPASWIICGGGRRNPLILGDLREMAERDGVKVLTADDLGLDGDAVEAEAWAYLAIRSRLGLALTFPTTTGCREAVSGGVFTAAASKK